MKKLLFIQNDRFIFTFVKKVLTMEDKINQIAIASDHAGFEFKEYIKLNITKLGYNVKDFGTFSSDRVDYPDLIHPLASAVNSGILKMGIILCGSGNGVAMVANKYKGIRAAVCWNEEITKLARLHNNANILAIPARFITKSLAFELVKIFLTTGFEGGRHELRVAKIQNLI